MEKKPTLIPRLGELEFRIIEHLWEVGEADVLQTHASVGVPRKISVNTVGSALERLFRKRLIRREKVSHAFRYQPVMDRDTFMAQRMVEAAGGLRALSQQGLLSAFIDAVTDASEDTLDELERLVHTKRRQQN